MDMCERGWHIMAVLGALSKLRRPHDGTSAGGRAAGPLPVGERVQPHRGTLGPLSSPPGRDAPAEEPRGGSSTQEAVSTPFSYVNPTFTYEKEIGPGALSGTIGDNKASLGYSMIFNKGGRVRGTGIMGALR